MVRIDSKYIKTNWTCPIIKTKFGNYVVFEDKKISITDRALKVLNCPNTIEFPIINKIIITYNIFYQTNDNYWTTIVKSDELELKILEFKNCYFCRIDDNILIVSLLTNFSALKLSDGLMLFEFNFDNENLNYKESDL